MAFCLPEPDEEDEAGEDAGDVRRRVQKQAPSSSTTTTSEPLLLQENDDAVEKRARRQSRLAGAALTGGCSGNGLSLLHRRACGVRSWCMCSDVMLAQLLHCSSIMGPPHPPEAYDAKACCATDAVRPACSCPRPSFWNSIRNAFA